MQPLTPRQRRLLAVLLMLAVLCGLVAAVLLPYRWKHRQYGEAIALHLDHIARYRRIASTRGDLEKAIAAIKSMNGTRFYLKSSNPSLAASDIQQVAQTLAEAHGLQVESMQIAPHKDEGRLRRVSLSLRLRGKLVGVRNMLYGVEATLPYLFVDNLSMQTTVRQSYVPSPGVEPDVTAQFDLSGYALIKKSDAPPRR